MYIPKQYQGQGTEWAAELLRRNPLALLISSGPDGPHATHIPAIFDETSAASDVIVGGHVYGHMNRMNPHWQVLGEDYNSLLVFQGPQGYVSPVLYETREAAPTWNFASVHLRGQIHVLTDRNDTLRVVMSTVEALERRFGMGWEMADSLGYFGKLLPGVGAFRMDIEVADCMLKLSQEQSADVQNRIIDAFTKSEKASYQELACLMKNFYGVPPRCS
jgi:transcriptional regulator